MKIKAILTIALVSCGVALHAQNMSTIMYNVGIGTGDLGEYIEPASFRGASFDYQYLVTDNIAVGFGIGWQTFYENKGFQTVTDGSSTLSGFQYRYLNSFPFHLTGTYFVDTGGDVKPYVGLGIGTIYNVRNTDMGLFTFETNQWHFSFRPEAGVQYDFSYTFAMRLNVRYVQGFNTSDLDGQNYIAVGVGFVFQN
jgi:opacity protein-like surface antigen